MRLICLGSGSSGNCFLLDSGGELLILDAGVPFKKLLHCKQLKSFSRVSGAVITHEHKDHSLSVPDLYKSGIEVFSPLNLKAGKKYRIGKFDVLPFLCVHDVETFGYIIRCATGETLAYATDTAALPPLKGVDYFVVECNYSEKLWQENVAKATMGFRYFGRVKECHMGLETLTGYFDALKVPAKAIILCHLSENGNADNESFKAAMAPYAALTDVAAANKEWELA